MTVSTRILTLLFLTVLLICGPISGTVGAAVVTDDVTTESAGMPLAQTETPSDNKSTQHENPDETDEGSDTDSVRRWLEGELGSRLSESAIRINEGQYERGRELLGDDYDGVLGKYVEVAGDTADGEQTTRQLERAREKQQTLGSSTQQYRQTVKQYREARRNGNETRARQLARKANRIAADINRTTTELNRTYREIDNRTNADVSDVIPVFGDIKTNVTTTQAQINEDLFVETTLSVTARPSSVSFLNPATVSGRVTLENGTAMANRTISLLIGGRTVSTTTDVAGRFSVRYRPTVVPLGQQNVTVTYLPTNASVYLASSDVLPLNVSQVETDLRLHDWPVTGSYADTATVSGRFSAGETGAANVPVAVVLDGVRVGTARTDESGNFTTTVRVPAGVRDGSRTLRVRVPLEERALEPANVTRQVTIESTPTTLTLSSESHNGDGVRASGRLMTTDGTSVPYQQVTLFVDGETIGTIETDSDGAFNTTVSLPQSVRPDEGTVSVTLAARYANDETNLGPSRATTSVSVQSLRTAGGDDGLFSLLSDLLTNPLTWLVVLGVFAVVVAFVRSQRADETGEEREGPTQDGSGTAGESPPTPGATDQLLTTAQDRLEMGDINTAVETAFAAVRDQSAVFVDTSSSSTHWEWYAACETAGLESEELELLRKLTEWYERAAFAPGTLDADTARRAVTSADEFISDRGTSRAD